MATEPARTSERHQRHLRKMYGNGAHIPDTPYGIGEALVVNGHALARVIDRFCTEWDADRPLGYPFNGDKTRFYGPMRWIHDQTGIPLRRLTAIRRGHAEHINMSRADAILQAIGDGTRLEDELEPYPNPRWSVERWRAYMAERGCV